MYISHFVTVCIFTATLEYSLCLRKSSILFRRVISSRIVRADRSVILRWLSGQESISTNEESESYTSDSSGEYVTTQDRTVVVYRTWTHLTYVLKTTFEKRLIIIQRYNHVKWNNKLPSDYYISVYLVLPGNNNNNNNNNANFCLKY